MAKTKEQLKEENRLLEITIKALERNILTVQKDNNSLQRDCATFRIELDSARRKKEVFKLQEDLKQEKEEHLRTQEKLVIAENNLGMILNEVIPVIVKTAMEK